MTNSNKRNIVSKPSNQNSFKKTKKRMDEELESEVKKIIFTHTLQAMDISYSQSDWRDKFDKLSTAAIKDIMKVYRSHTSTQNKPNSDEAPLKRSKPEPEKVGQPTPMINPYSFPGPFSVPNGPQRYTTIPIYTPRYTTSPVVESKEEESSTLRWTFEEEQLLVDCRFPLDRQQLTWKETAAKFPTRKESTVKNHWHNSVKERVLQDKNGKHYLPRGSATAPPPPPPPQKVQEPKRKGWTEMEITKLTDLVKDHDKSEIGFWLKEFPGRTHVEICDMIEMTI
jgi:hypothetical protein